MLDLYHFSFHVIDQVHLPDLPGVLVTPPPKKNNRGGHRDGTSRENDLLVLFLSLAGKNSLKEEELNALLERISQAYYQVWRFFNRRDARRGRNLQRPADGTQLENRPAMKTGRRSAV